MTFSLSTVEKLNKSPVESLSAAELQSSVKHVKKEEEKFKSLIMDE